MRRSSREAFGNIKPLPSGKFFVRYTHEGERHTLGTFDTEKKAIAALNLIWSDIQRGLWMDARKGEMTFGEVVNDVLDQSRSKLTPGTIRTHESLLRTILKPFMHMRLDQITEREVDLWWAKNADHPVNRRNGYYLLKKTMDKAVKYKYIRSTPCLVDEPGKDVAEARPDWSYDDFLRVLEALPEDIRTPVLVLFSGHLRIGELCGLNRRNYDAKTGILTVDHQASLMGGSSTTKTKTKNVKEVKLLTPGMDALAGYMEKNILFPTAPLFAGPKGTRLTRAWVRKAWVTACDEVGLSNFHLHDLRHVSLTLVGRSGASFKDVMARGGHQSPTSAMRYQHATRERDIEVASATDLLLAR